MPFKEEQRPTWICERNLLSGSVAESVSDWRYGYGHDRSYTADDNGPEDCWLLARGPADVHARVLEELNGRHGRLCVASD